MSDAFFLSGEELAAPSWGPPASGIAGEEEEEEEEEEEDLLCRAFRGARGG